MIRTWVLLVLYCPFLLSAQQINNEIFEGGRSDGHALSCYAQKDLLEDHNRIFSGGEHDGAAVSCYAQKDRLEKNNGIFEGGLNDGHHLSCYAQDWPDDVENNRIFEGGRHDGFSENCYEQADNPDPLPIELISYRGECSGEKQVLKWQMASEDHLSFYRIERIRQKGSPYSIDTIRRSNGSFYRYEVNASEYPKDRDYAYYTLYAVDLDGERDELGTIAVRNCSRSQGRINIYPVPSKGMVHIEYEGQKPLVKRIRLMDAYGAVIERIKGNPERLILKELPPGVYYLAFYKKEGVEHRRLIIE